MTTINIRELLIDTRTFGDEYILIAINPVYEYANNQRTKNVIGYRYTVVLPSCNFAQLDVKIVGAQMIELKDRETMSVKFDDLTVHPYVNYRNHNALAVTATAVGIRRA